jgi:acyl-CoA synthetase (AMP-forming)/AMP-acid ligase II
MLVGQAYIGGTLVMMRKWDPALALDLIEKERVKSFSGVPAMVWDLVNSPDLAGHDLGSLGSLSSGGAAAPPELTRKIATVLPGRGAATGYGLTETSSIVTSNSGEDYLRHPDSVGVAVPVCELRITDLEGEEVPIGTSGEIWIKGPNVVPGYWNRRQDTEERFVQGWLRTGDIGRLDDEGFLYIVDRAKDIIIRGGENISSLEVEAVIYEFPGVAQAAVFPVPHARLGEEVGAVVVRLPGTEIDVDALRAHARNRLAAFMVPSHVWVTDSPLPRNGAGKVLKRQVREMYVPDPGS